MQKINAQDKNNPDVSNTKFKIIYQDGSVLDSHDENWDKVADHTHALAPNNTKKWQEYQIWKPDGFFVAVNFNTGVFNVNNLIIHPARSDGYIYANLAGESNYATSEEWKILNGLPYFPVVGRRQFKGQNINMTVPFCGWKKLVNDRRVDRILYLYPDNHIVFGG